MAIDEAKLNEFMGAFVHDIGAVMHAATIVLGDELGLYKALAGRQLSAEELAADTSTDPRYVREWLSSQAASGYVQYDASTGKFSMTEEQALALAEEGSPAFIPGAFQIAVAQFSAIPKMINAFRTGNGLGWHEHDHALFHGTQRFFRPGYAANLVTSWLPALSGVEDKLKAGARVADVGCGYGASTILMAQAYPESRFFGFDYHEPSIRSAREAAAEAGVTDRVQFEVASAKTYPERDYDLVAFFDCLHDMGDPVGRGASRARDARRRRHVDDRRAVRARPARGKPQPGGPRVLLARPPSSARRRRGRRRSACASARRRAKRAYATLRTPAASAASGGPRKRRSIWFTKRVLERR